MHRIFLLFYCCLILIAKAYPQTKYIDSLRQITQTSKSQDDKLWAYIWLGYERQSLHADSLKKYALEVEKIATVINSEDAMLEAKSMIVFAYTKKGNYNEALEIIKSQVVKTYETPILRHKQRKFYIAKGVILNITNKPEEAQQVFFTALKQAEDDNDSYLQAAALNGIGWSYTNLNNDIASISWYKKAITILSPLVAKNRAAAELMVILTSNIGPVYLLQYQKNKDKKYADTAVYYIDTAIVIARKNEFLGMLSICLGYKGLLVYETEKNSTKAEAIMNEGLEMRKRIGDLYLVMVDMTKMAEFYYKTKQPLKGITICKEGIRLADSANIKSDIIYFYELLARNYKDAGMYKEYGEAISTQLFLKDSINTANTATSLNEIQTKYQVEKKEALIAKQKYDLLRRNVLLYGLIAIVTISLFVGFFRFRSYKKNQKQRLDSLMAEEKKLRVSATKEAQEKERKRIAAELHDNLGVQTNAILHNSNLLAENNLAGNASVISNLQETAKEMMVNLRETLWAMRTNEIAAIEIWLRVINFMKQMGRHYSNLIFKTEGDVPQDFILSSAQALDLVLVIQEAVNNAVKHAYATNIIVKNSYANNNWIITVSDDGQGFDIAASAEKKDSYGLGNMEDRAKAGNFNMDIESIQGSGTTLKIVIPHKA